MKDRDDRRTKGRVNELRQLAVSVTFYDITLFNLQMSDLAYIDKILVVAFLQVHQNSGLIQLTEIKHRKLKFMS